MLLFEFVLEHIAHLEAQGDLGWHECALTVGGVGDDALVAFAGLKGAEPRYGDTVKFAAPCGDNAGECFEQLSHIALIAAQLAGDFFYEFAIVHLFKLRIVNLDCLELAKLLLSTNISKKKPHYF